MNVLYVSNRVAVNLQQKQELAKVLGANDLFKTLTFYGWQAQEEIGGVRILTYQRLFQLLHNSEEREWLQSVQLFVFDEVHALMHDASFVGETGALLAQIPEIFRAASRIYISATPDSILPELSLAEGPCCDAVPIYSFHRTFAFVDPFFFTSMAQIAERINADKSDEKWLVFIPSLRSMQEIGERLQCEYSVLSAATREEQPDAWEQLLTTEKFEQKVLLCTSVIDSGVNFHDPLLTNIVSFSLNSEEIIQQIGRKRRTRKDEKLKVFVREPSLRTVTRRLYRLTELDEGLQKAGSCPTQFLEQQLLREDAPDYRRLCYVDKAGTVQVNPLARKFIARQIDVLKKLQMHGQRHNGDCAFAEMFLRALTLPRVLPPNHWLDDRHSGTARNGWLQLLQGRVGHKFETTKEQEAFAKSLQKLYAAAFGKRKGDRPDREWGTTIINRVLTDTNTGLVLRSVNEAWILDNVLKKQEES